MDSSGVDKYIILGRQCGVYVYIEVHDIIVPSGLLGKVRRHTPRNNPVPV